MAADAAPAGSAGDWIRHARADLALARVATSPPLLELLCFHAQQACEKSLKAVLVHFGTTVPRTHNLQTLLDLVFVHCSVPPELLACSELTDYAVTTRYPGVYEPVTDIEHREAVQKAEAILRWVEGLVGLTPLS